MSTAQFTSPEALLAMMPESAPFSPAQRAWLSGFLSGFMNAAFAPAVPGINAPVAAGAPAAAPTAPEAEEEFPYHDPALKVAERLEMTADKPVARKLMSAMAQLDCGACGYLCQTYGEAIAKGEEKDLTRCTPGGKETNKALKEILAKNPLGNNFVPAEKVTTSKAAATGGAYTRDNPFKARLVRATPLNATGSAKDTRHVVFDLRNSGLSYKVGDALGVYPENCPDTVSRIMAMLGANGAEDVDGRSGDSVSLRHALLRERTLNRPSDELLALLAESATDETEQAELRKLATDGLPDGDMRHVIDLLEQYKSAKPAVDDFVEALSLLQPRLYSISSSLLACPNEVHLTVGVVRYTNTVGRKCNGVASTYFSDHLRPGQHVRVFVHQSPKFGLPKDRNTPIIMVGPGTGIAPFRAFLLERKVDRHPGKNWLFFGDQKSDSDFLYRDELEAMQAEGVLTKLDTAFSRDQAEKIYVQTRMQQNGAEIWKWLQEGAHFYVCGDASRMAKDVDNMLKQIVTEHGGVNGEAYVAEMSKAGRYQRDVY